MERIWREAPLDILVNNAAGNFLARTERLSPRAIDSVLNIVLHGTAYCTLACGRRWIEAGRAGTMLGRYRRCRARRTRRPLQWRRPARSR